MYKWFDRLSQDREYQMFTVVNGKNKGEKLIACGETVIFCSNKYGFLSQNLKKMNRTEKNRLFIIEGQEVFCEQIGCEACLVICGAGYVSLALIKMAKNIGMHITVIEDRLKFADFARRAGADKVYCESFHQGLQYIEENKDTYFVVVTRGHRFDTECLEEILKRSYAYLGMMGSRHRVAAMKRYLLTKGYKEEAIEQIHMPIGLSIGAESPEEIAISILAEIIMIKNKRRKASEYSREMIQYLTGKKEEDQKKVLATIVEKHGSAPRKEGTKMLVLADGRTIGTIGGGCAENEVIREALDLMNDRENSTRIFSVSMLDPDMQEMMCGGKMRVFLEKI